MAADSSQHSLGNCCWAASDRPDRHLGQENVAGWLAHAQDNRDVQDGHMNTVSGPLAAGCCRGILGKHFDHIVLEVGRPSRARVRHPRHGRVIAKDRGRTPTHG